MWSWLGKIDPDTVVWVVSIAGSFVWSRLWGKAREGVEKAIDAVVDNFILEFLDREPHPSIELNGYVDRARKFIDDRAWPILAKRGVKRSKTAEALLNAAIERGTAKLRREIAERRKARAEASATDTRVTIST